MARFVYRTLIPAGSSHSYTAAAAAWGVGLSSRARLIWSQAAEASSQSQPGAEAEARMVEKIEDLIHSIIVKRSKPDWLPFVAGASYWIPPRRPSYGVAQVINKLSNPLSDDDFLSLTTLHPLPSSHFYLDQHANESTSTLDLAEEKTLSSARTSEKSSSSPLVSEELNLSSAEISAESNSPLDPAERNLSSTETSTGSTSPLDSAEGEPLLTNPAPEEEET